MNSNTNQPTGNAVTLPIPTSEPENKEKLRQIIAQHYEGAPDAVQSVVGLPEDMQPIFFIIMDYLFKTVGVKFLCLPLDKLTPRQMSARLLIEKIDILRTFIAECPDWFNPVIACAVSAGADLMRLAETDPNSSNAMIFTRIIAEALNTQLPKIEKASSRAARSGSKCGVKEVFRERDLKSRRNMGNHHDGQYDEETWKKAFDKVEALLATKRKPNGKLPHGVIGEAFETVWKNMQMLKVTVHRFRRKYYADRGRPH